MFDSGVASTKGSADQGDESLGGDNGAVLSMPRSPHAASITDNSAVSFGTAAFDCSNRTPDSLHLVIV
jgi:hypothetical protein